MPNQLSKIFLFDINEANLPIRAEQIHARLRSYPLMIVGQIVIALLLVSMMWDKLPQPVLLIWLAALFVELMVESSYAWRDVESISSLEDCKRWRKCLLVSVTLTSLIWGAGGVLLFVPDNLTYQALLICVYLGIAAGAATTNPVFPPALYIYISLVILPLMLLNLVIGDHTHFILAGMLLVYWGFLLSTGRGLSKTFELSLRRAVENEQLLAQLTEEKQRVELASQTKTRFLAAASHDLRQPVHALALLVEALKGHVQGAEGNGLRDKLEISIEALGGMLNALLDVSRLDAGVVKPSCERFAMQPLLDRLYDDFGVFADKQGLHLEIASCDAIVYSDAVLLELVLRNLLSNALRHTSEGEVSLICQPVAGGLQLTVCDTGIGIAPEFLTSIFEEYYQIGNRQRDRRKGLGLGLAIVKRLDNLLGLQLQVHSTLGEGTTFTLMLPERQLAESPINIASTVDGSAAEQ